MNEGDDLDNVSKNIQILSNWLSDEQLKFIISEIENSSDPNLSVREGSKTYSFFEQTLNKKTEYMLSDIRQVLVRMPKRAEEKKSELSTSLLETVKNSGFD